MERKPDFTDEEVGIRSFHLRRAAAAEKALEKIRKGLGNQFLRLRNDEIETLLWALGEIWTLVGFYDWEEIRFSELKLEDVLKILDASKEVLAHKKTGTQAFSEIYNFLKENYT